MTEHTSDAVLVHRALQSDMRAYEQIVEKYYSRVYRLCLRAVSSPFDAEDITQDVFVNAYLSLHQLRSPEKLYSWLLGMASNLSKKWLQYKYRTTSSISLEVFDESVTYWKSIDPLAPTVEEEVLSRMEYSPLGTAMMSMSEKSREALTLHCLENMSYNDIAKLLSVPVSTVRGRIYNARQWLLEYTMAPDIPQDLRTRIANIVVKVAENHHDLRQHLYADVLRNQLVLELLNRAGVDNIPMKAFVYNSHDILDLMITDTSEPYPYLAVIKTYKKFALSAFLQLLPQNKPIHLVLIAPGFWDTVESFCTVDSGPSKYLTYCLAPRELNALEDRANVNEVSLLEKEVLEELLAADPRLQQVLEYVPHKNPESLKTLKLFVHHNDYDNSIDSYALLLCSETGSLWELACHGSFNKESNHGLKRCISIGASTLAKLGYYVTANGIPSEDTTIQQILEDTGFASLWSYTTAQVTLK